MVAIGEHDHGDGPVCPGCQFKAALAGYFAESRHDGDEEWHWATGDLRKHMHAALLALDRIEAEAFGDATRHDDHDHARDAADALFAIDAELHKLWHVLVEHDDLGDDAPDVGL